MVSTLVGVVTGSSLPWIRASVIVTDSLPEAPIPAAYSRVTAVLLVAAVLLPFMFLAETSFNIVVWPQRIGYVNGIHAGRSSNWKFLTVDKGINFCKVVCFGFLGTCLTSSRHKEKPLLDFSRKDLVSFIFFSDSNITQRAYCKTVYFTFNLECLPDLTLSCAVGRYSPFRN